MKFLILYLIAALPAFAQNTGVGAKPIEGAEVIFDGSFDLFEELAHPLRSSMFGAAPRRGGCL